jgi:tetratricopeptide (TPR) repeat protein
MIRFTIITLIIFGHSYVKAQECDNALYKSAKLYEAGNIEDAIGVLEPCIDQMKKADLKFESYKLLAQAYLSTGNDEKAKECAIKMLKISPEYKKYPNNDATTLKSLLNEIEVTEKILLGAAVGVGGTSVNVIKSYSALQVPQRYVNTIGYIFGGNLTYVHNKLQFGVGLLNQGLSIVHQHQSEFGWTKTYTEQLRALNLRLNVGYEYELNHSTSLIPSVHCGTSIFNSSYITVQTDNDLNSGVELVTKDNIDFINNNQYYLGGSLSIAKKLTRGQLIFGFSYSHFISNKTNAEKRYDDINFILDSGYISDDLNISTSNFSIGYQLPIFYSVK